jgi:cbb3-type cytochrome oxidase subunit 1
MYKEAWGWGLFWSWNAFLILGSVSFLFGFNMGIEAGEFEWPLNRLRSSPEILSLFAAGCFCSLLTAVYDMGLIPMPLWPGGGTPV